MRCPAAACVGGLKPTLLSGHPLGRRAGAKTWVALRFIHARLAAVVVLGRLGEGLLKLGRLGSGEDGRD